jgi:hypothetical protein
MDRTGARQSLRQWFTQRQWGSSRIQRTHNCAPIDHLTLAPTVGRDLRKRPSAQRFPAFC